MSVNFSVTRQGRQRDTPRVNRFSRFDKIPQHGRIRLKMPFVLRDVAHFVRFGQHSPDRGRKPKGVRQGLEHQVAAVGAITMPAECYQREGVCRVIGQVEPARQCQSLIAGVPQPFGAGLQQPLDLARGAGLDNQLSDAREIRQFSAFLRQGFPPYQ